jgi:hypothetical protein
MDINASAIDNNFIRGFLVCSTPAAAIEYGRPLLERLMRTALIRQYHRPDSSEELSARSFVRVT